MLVCTESATETMLASDAKVVSKYLQNYAEPESRNLPRLPHYKHCLVIPVFDEQLESLKQVWQNLDDHFLIILVINAPAEQPATLNLMQEIIASATAITGSATAIIGNDRCTLLSTASSLQGQQDILLIDRCTPGNTIPPRQGVGLARKIGADIALRLIVNGVLDSPRISCTDADAELPKDYFATVLTTRDAALVFPFIHQPEPGLELPTLLYELSILYYACGLHWAGSGYGYTSLGSTMVINAVHYAKVRGFPRRNAAEDFYLLNKLAKTGRINALPVTPILLSGRISDRVPVGTGPGIRKISNLDSPLDDYRFYHPRIFVLLREFLNSLRAIWDTPDSLASSSEEIKQYCRESGLSELITRQLHRQKHKAVFEKFLFDWFDGFRTLKFVHFLRDDRLPSIPLNELASAEFVDADFLADLPLLKQQLSDRLFRQKPPPAISSSKLSM